MKALLFTLVRSFEFELALPASEMTTRQIIVSRPYLKADMDAGSQLPLLVRRVASS